MAALCRRLAALLLLACADDHAALAAPQLRATSAGVVPGPGPAEDGDLAAPVAATDAETDKVQRLLIDIDESVKKAGSDAELVYAMLYTYDQQLEASLNKEIDMVSTELDKLKAMQTRYRQQVGEAGAELGKLGEAALASAQQFSKYSEGSAKTNKDFDTILDSVKMLVTYLQRGSVEQMQGVVTSRKAPRAQLARVCHSVRQLLSEHQGMRSQFKDVYAAFLPPVALVQKASRTSKLGGPALVKVRLTPALRARTVAALEAIRDRLAKQRSQALLQLSSWQQKMKGQATVAEVSTHARQGIQAEEEQKVEELAFSVTFTEAVLRIDKDFQLKVRSSVKKKAELVETIRGARQSQHKTLTALVDLLRGKYSVDSQAAADAARASAQTQAQQPLLAAPAFLQVAREAPPPAASSSLQLEIEAALRKKEDTHGILMRIKAMLDKAAPIDADSVQSVLSEFGGVLRTVSSEQSREDEAKQRCESQALHSKGEAQGLRANLALMNAVDNHTKAAIQAAKYNLQGIMAKTKALEMSTEDFSSIVTRTTNTLEDQSRDRRTIMTAVQKAREILTSRPGSGPAAGALLGQMLMELQVQERGEHAYRSSEVNFRGAFLAYARSYLQLLRERKGHYESALSALELYADEVESDGAAQAEFLRNGQELQKEGAELCEGVIRAYTARARRRTKLMGLLRAVLPDMPGVLGVGSFVVPEPVVVALPP